MSRKTVLVVDDDRSFVDAVAILLGEFGYRVLKAYSGHEGLDFLPHNNINVAIIDVNMPDMDGVELAGVLAELDTPIPTVLISSDDSEENATRCRALGAGVFLAKPLDPEVLLETVSRALAKST